MARYQIILAYDGTDFLGSQRQAGARTVQRELERALAKIGWQGKSILLAGRTDTGTHASGQVAAFDLDWGHGLAELHRALNANLPQDMAVRSVDLAAVDFHPRFSATSRRYRYRLFCQEIRDPLRERYAWRVWPPVADLTPLAALWAGKHDFAAYGSPTTPSGSTVRTVFSATWQQHDEEWIFDVQADAFLYRMVRRLVYTQAAVGQGRLTADELLRALQNRPEVQPRSERRTLMAGLAPASGLTLVEVRYDNLV